MNSKTASPWTLAQSLQTLFKITSNRLEYERKQASKGQPVHVLYRRETEDLAQTHDFLEDHFNHYTTLLTHYNKLVTEEPKLKGAQEGFFKCLDKMSAHGLLPPISKGPANTLITNVQNSINRINAQRSQTANEHVE